jgi:hypothetical protein
MKLFIYLLAVVNILLTLYLENYTAVSFIFFNCLGYLIFYILKKTNLLLTDISSNNYHLFNNFYYLLNNLFFFSNYLNTGSLNQIEGDVHTFTSGAERFAYMGEINYSAMDYFTGYIIRVYDSLGLSYTTYSFMPLIVLVSTITYISLFSFSCSFLNDKNQRKYIILFIITLPTFNEISVGLWRDNFALLPMIVSLNALKSYASISMASLFLLPAYFFRPANFVVGIFFIFSKRFFSIFKKNVFLSFLIVIVSLASIFITRDFIAQINLGSFTREGGSVDILAGRDALMANEAQKARGTDFSVRFYEMGLAGLPFRLALNTVSAVRIRGIYGMVVVNKFTREMRRGVYLSNIYFIPYLMFTPFFLSHIYQGIYLTLKDKLLLDYLSVLVIILIVLSFFSLQGRHFAMMYILYPIFLSHSLNYENRRKTFFRSMIHYILFVFMFLINIPNIFNFLK